jgi:hypothetical protein
LTNHFRGKQSNTLPKAALLVIYEVEARMKDRLKSLARCAEGMLANLAVVGIGLALFEQKWWPALAIGAATAVVTLILAWSVPHD